MPIVMAFEVFVTARGIEVRVRSPINVEEARKMAEQLVAAADMKEREDGQDKDG